MSADSYRKLARNLDALPNRFPETESGVEIRILEHLFSPEEVVIAAELSAEKKSAAEIADLAGVSEKEARSLLKGMVRRQLILFSKGESALVYGLMPFVVGFYETSLPVMTEEYAKLFEEYMEFAASTYLPTAMILYLRMKKKLEIKQSEGHKV